MLNKSKTGDDVKLSLSYNRCPKKIPLKKEKLSTKFERINVTNVSDYEKLVLFLFLPFNTFYSVFIKSNSVVKNVINFIEQQQKTYSKFVSIVTYTVKNNTEVYGHHYVVACNNVLSVTIFLQDKKKYDNLKPLNSSCVVLTDYTDEKITTLHEFFNNVIGTVADELVLLGSLYQNDCKPSEAVMSMQIKNLKTAQETKNLLKLIEKHHCFEKNHQGLIQTNSRDAVECAINSLEKHAKNLNKAENLLDLQTSLQNLYFTLKVFDANYLIYLQEVLSSDNCLPNHGNVDSIVSNVLKFVSEKCYHTIDGVICRIYPECDYSKPNVFIVVSKTNIQPLLLVFKLKGYLGLPLVQRPVTDDSDHWLINNKTNEKPVCFTKLVNIQHYNRSSADDNCKPYRCTDASGDSTSYFWICIQCEGVIVTKSDNELMCKCGIEIMPKDPFENLHRRLHRNGYVEQNLENNWKNDDEKTEEKKTVVPRDQTISVETPVTKNEEKRNISIAIPLSHIYTLTAHIIAPKIRTYTIVVVGASGAGKSTLLNNIFCIQQHKTLENAVENGVNCLLPVTFENTNATFDGIQKDNDNESYGNPGQSVTQRPKDYIIDYGSFKIRFVDTPGTAGTRGTKQDIENVKYIQKHLLGLSEVHGFMFVIKNSETKLSVEFENTMRSLLGLVPRRAIQNCFFVYTFSGPDNFRPGSVQGPLRILLQNFNKQHDVNMEMTALNEFCVDNKIFRELLNHQISSASPYNLSSDYWSKNSDTIDRIFKNVKLFVPVARYDFELTFKLTQLGDLLRPYIKTEAAEHQRLLASVGIGGLNGINIYCRKNSFGAQPLNVDEWAETSAVWKHKNENVSNYIKEVDDFLQAAKQKEMHEAITAITKPDLMQIIAESLIEVSSKFVGISCSVDVGDNQNTNLQSFKTVECLTLPATEECYDSKSTINEPYTMLTLEEKDIRSCKTVEVYMEMDLMPVDNTEIDRHQATSTFSSSTDNKNPEWHVLTPVDSTLTMFEKVHETVDDNRLVQQHNFINGSSPEYTVLVAGGYRSLNSALIKLIYSGKSLKDNDINKNLKFDEFADQDECVIEYGSFKVRFINVVTTDGLSIKWDKYPSIHGFIFTFQCTFSISMTNIKNQLFDLFGMVPRRAVKNCFIFTFVQQQSSFNSTKATVEVSKILHSFKENLSLDNLPGFLCVDHEITKSNLIVPDILSNVKTNVENFFTNFLHYQSISPTEMEFTKCIVQLGWILKHMSSSSIEYQRLKKSVAHFCIYRGFHEYQTNNTTLPLSEEEWSAAPYWNIDDKVRNVIKKINQHLTVTRF